MTNCAHQAKGSNAMARAGEPSFVIERCLMVGESASQIEPHNRYWMRLCALNLFSSYWSPLLASVTTTTTTTNINCQQRPLITVRRRRQARARTPMKLDKVLDMANRRADLLSAPWRLCSRLRNCSRPRLVSIPAGFRPRE